MSPAVPGSRVCPCWGCDSVGTSAFRMAGHLPSWERSVLAHAHEIRKNKSTLALLYLLCNCFGKKKQNQNRKTTKPTKKPKLVIGKNEPTAL